MPLLPRRLLALCLLIAAPVLAVDTKIESGSGPQITPITGIQSQNLGTLDSGSGAAPLQTGDGALPALPASAVDSPQVSAAPSRPGERPDEKPPGPAGPGIQTAPLTPVAPQAAPPYFVGALTRLGVPADLAQRLSDYQESRHPGDQSKVYHGLAHSQDVPAAIAMIVEGPAGQSLTQRQKILLIVSAAFHDIDPERAPETPARVSATLPYLEQDPGSRALLAELGRRYGFALPQVEALIKATDFNPDPAGQKKIQEDFERMAANAFAPEDKAWALEWGRKLSFADKSATYLGSVESADQQVRNLANEIRHGIAAATGKESANPTDESMLRGSKNFLKVLRDSPDYAILPATLRTNFEQVYAHFDKLADPATPIPPAANRARAPPSFGQAALDAARGEAGVRAPSSTVRPPATTGPDYRPELSKLNTVGYAVLPAGALSDAAAEQAVLDVVARDWMKGGEPVLGQLPFEDPVQPKWRQRVADIREAMMPVIEALTARLNEALPGENIEIRDVQLRLASPSKPENRGVHVDLGGYMTATYAIKGRGTILYKNENGRTSVGEAPTRSWAIITNMEREAATGKTGTVHDTPFTDQDRVLVIVRFKRAGQKPLTDEQRRLASQRAQARIQGALSAVARQGAKPGSAGKKGLLSKLFGE